jgi:hypothetical protein
MRWNNPCVQPPTPTNHIFFIAISGNFSIHKKDGKVKCEIPEFVKLLYLN